MAKAFQRSYKFLPEVFQTAINRKFLNNTMDNLIAPGTTNQLNNYIGRRYSKGSKPSDRWLAESDSTLRTAYQLEVGAASREADGTYTFGATYEDLILAIQHYGGNVAELGKILKDDFRPADLKIDLDKLVNYRQYYWLPQGPDPILINFGDDNRDAIKANQFSSRVLVYFDDGHYYIRTSSIPEHIIDAFPNAINDRALADKTLTYKFPRDPANVQVQNSVAVDPASQIGVAVNGLPLMTYTLGTTQVLGQTTYTINTPFLEQQVLAFDDYGFDTVGLDAESSFAEDLKHRSPTAFRGHPDANGVYHYHTYTSVFYEETPTGHSPILGFAFDGFPIYGPYAWSNQDGTGEITRMRSSFRLRERDQFGEQARGTPDGRFVEDFEYVDGLGDLDVNNGRFCVTPEFPKGTYAYFMTLDEVGTPAFPYIMGPRYHGSPVKQSGDIAIPAELEVYTRIAGYGVNIERDIIGKTQFSIGDIKFTNGLRVLFGPDALPKKFANNEYYVEGVGTAIELVRAGDLRLPEVYIGTITDKYDLGDYDETAYEEVGANPIIPDYIVAKRNDQSLSGWTRINRWFHIDVIEATARYLNKPVVVDNRSRAKRPIIEFDANMALYNHAQRNIAFVDVFDTTITDAFSTVQGSPGYTLDGVTLANGTKIVFAADTDPDVRKRVYEVEMLYLDEGRATSEFVSLDSDIASATVSGNFVDYTIAVKQDQRVLIYGTDYSISNATATSGDIVLVNPLPIPTELEVVFMDLRANIRLKEYAVAEDYDGILTVSGLNKLGDDYYYKNGGWISGQPKNRLNVEPLFDLFDASGNRISDRNSYQGSTFTGNKLFAYKRGSGPADSVLGFPISYSSIDNVSDIQFTWHHSADTFSFVVGRGTSTSLSTENFYVYDHKKQTFRATTAATGKVQDLMVMDLRYIDVDIDFINLQTDFISNNYQQTLFVYVNDVLVTRGNDYDVEEQLNSDAQVIGKRIRFRNSLVVGDKVLIRYLPAETLIDKELVWDVPVSLSINPYNEQILDLDLGAISKHYASGVGTVLNFNGVTFGPNNSRDIQINSLCGELGYNNGNLLLATALLKNQDFGFIESIEFARDEYTKFKNNLIQIYESGSFSYDIDKPGDLLDSLLSEWALGKTSEFPFVDSDMVPGYTNFTETRYSVKYQQDKTYPLREVWSDEEESRRAVLIYHNGTLLIRGKDYEFNTVLPSVILSPALDIEEYDTILIREYDTTVNNFVPPTPAKLGLSELTYPELVTVDMPGRTVRFIRGHDGSMTPAWPGDDNERNFILLDLERRIYNNIKKSRKLAADKIRKKFAPLPGAFRNTLEDLNNGNFILNRSFGQWILKSNLDYTLNDIYNRGDEWTWNYRGQRDYTGRECPVGHWQGIYQWYFDCQYPNVSPWEMLGFINKPDWWDEEYGPAPYTKKNTKLWTDLEMGLIRQGDFKGIDPNRVRGDSLQAIIPVDDHGNLLSPLASGLIPRALGEKLGAPWQFGDWAPVEAAWRRSSESQYAYQEYAAINGPRQYFGLGFDLLDMAEDSVDGLVKINLPAEFLNRPVRQEDVALSIATATQANGYMAWLEGRSKQMNVASEDFATFIKNIEPRLMYKLSGFSDKDKLRFYINSANVGTDNVRNLLPEDSYQLILDKSAPIDRLTYSGVIVTKVLDGWKVEGYDKQNANFYILPSISPGPSRTVRVGAKPESFVEREEGKRYVKGQVVEVDDKYYRVIKDHESSDDLGINTLLAPLSGLPEIGGIVGIVWDTFDTTPVRVPYGTRFATIQEVFDFIISYGRYLESRGFLFNQYNNELGEILNWELSGKELLYWSTQNWNIGAQLTLSPSSTLISIYVPQGDVDSLYAPTSDPKSVLNQNSEPLTAVDLNVDRNYDLVEIVPVFPAEKPIYYLSANVRNFDHLAIFDNRTTFNDVIYNPVTGARQERLEIKGFRSNAWNGKFFIPGFTLDQNKISEWESFKDYRLGDLVKLGNTVYQCVENHLSDTLFDYDKFEQTVKQPKLYMQANLETLADQMDRYYGLSSEQIASDVSKYARHLIGFQNREYLEDLLANDETQFKFYQGMITQKGTEEAVSKLLRASVTDGTDIPEVDIKDEWALRVGEFGQADNVDDIEVRLHKADFFFDKTLLDLEGNRYPDRDLIGVNSTDIITTGERVMGALFPMARANFTEKTAGPVRTDHVDVAVLTSDDLSQLAGTVTEVAGSLLWVARDLTRSDQGWNVYRTRTSDSVQLTGLANEVVSLSRPLEVSVGELIWIYPVDKNLVDTSDAFSGPYIVKTIDNTALTMSFEGETGFAKDKSFEAYVVQIDSVRLSTMTMSDANGDRIIDSEVGSRVWVDNYENGWAVFKLEETFGTTKKLEPKDANSLIAAGTNLYAWLYFTTPWLAAQMKYTPASASSDTAVTIWERINDDGDLQEISTPIRPEDSLVDVDANFGAAIVHADRDTLVIGAPLHDGSGLTDSGSVVIYNRNAIYATWDYVGKIESDEDGAEFGSVLVRLSETEILVGAPGVGKVYLLNVSNLSSPALTELTNGGTGFGAEVSLSGTLLSIRDEDSYGNLHLYRITGTTLSAPLTITGSASAKIDTARVYADDAGEYAVIADSTGDGAVRIFKILSTAGVPTSAILHQTLTPNSITEGYDRAFGSNLAITANGRLIVGDTAAAHVTGTTLDNNTTTFDGVNTTFSGITQSSSTSVYKKIGDSFIFESEEFAPVNEDDASTGYGQVIATAGGEIFVSEATRTPTTQQVIYVISDSAASGWQVEHQQESVVDMQYVHRALNYDPFEAKLLNFLSIYDPLSSHHDSNAMLSIDYVIASDPAVYQTDRPGTNYWAEERVGEVWWDTRRSYWVDYQQGEAAYRVKHWGQLFPASQIDVYEWVESTVVPALYNLDNADPSLGFAPFGEATPYNAKIIFGADGLTYNLYYFWVRRKQFVESRSKKNVPVSEIERLLTFGPDKYIAPAGENMIITKNLDDDFIRGEQVLQVELIRSTKTNPQHNEWALLNEGDKVAPPSTLEAKMIDSLTGLDAANNIVPDPKLSAFKRIGTKFRPRQTMFNDRISAIQTAVEFINDRLAESILVDISLGDLEDKDPVPLQYEVVETVSEESTFESELIVTEETVLNWDERQPTYADIIEDELPNKPVGYKILVDADENFFDYWTIYTWTGTSLELTRIQRYDVTRYWQRVDYYDNVNFTDKSIPDATVGSEQEFIQNNYPVGTLVKVLGTGGWRVLKQEENGESTIVAMQNGTIRITLEKADFDTSLSFDTVGYDAALWDPQPSIEFRKILESMRDNIFINGREAEWNRLFFRMLRYALVEQTYLDWAIKSSFIKVTTTIGSLTQRPVYSLDTDDSLEKYIKEIKPYHTKIREYAAAYKGSDLFGSQTTDFDCPPYYDGAKPKRSVITEPTQEDLFTNYMPWRSFRDYHRHSVVAIVVVAGGKGFNGIPTIELRGGLDPRNVTMNRQARAEAFIGTGKQSYTSIGDDYFNFRRVWAQKQQDNGQSIDPNSVLPDLVGSGPYAVTRIEVIDGGEGYITPPEVAILGGGGTGARAYAVLGDSKQRMFRIGMKFDRVQGTADILPSSMKDYSSVVPGYDEWHAADRLYAHYTPDQETGFGLPEEITVTHTGDGSEVEFACPFGFNYAEQIRVSIDGEIVTGYTVHETTKTVEFTSAPEEGAEIVIALKPALLGLLEGADFDRTKIVGPTFNSGPGFDSQTRGFDSVMFDNWDLDPSGQYVEMGGYDTFLSGGRFNSSLGVDPTEVIRVYTGDGVTADIDLKFTPDPTTLLVKIGNDVKILDTDFTVADNILSFNTAPAEGAVITIARVLRVTVGDGTVKNYTLAEEIGSARTLSITVDGIYLKPNDDFTVEGDTITLVVAPAAGKVVVIENVYSSIANGGDFLSPEAIPSTEECINGQVFDTVDIKVYSQPIAGANTMALAAWEGNGTQTRFALTELPNTLQHITVFVNGLAQNPELVTVDYETREVVFTSAPGAGDMITAVIVKDQGVEVHQVQTFMADGETRVFRIVNADTSSTDIDTDRNTIVIVNGVKQDASSYTVAKNNGDLVFTLDSEPAEDATVKIIVYAANQVGDSYDVATYDVTAYDPQTPGGKRYSETFSEVVTLDPAVGAYYLRNPAGALAPLTASTICHVVAGPDRVGERLRPADTAYYVADGATTTFDLPNNPEENYGAYTNLDLRVAVNGLPLDISDYSFDPVAKTLTLVTPPDNSQLVTITTFPSGDYYVRDGVLFFNSSVNFNGTKVLVQTLNDSSVVGFRTEVFSGGTTVTLSYGFGAGGFGVSGWGMTTSTTAYTGEVVLSSYLLNVNQAQVYVNGIYKTPGQDWVMKNGTLDTLVIAGGVETTDVVTVHYTTGGRARAATGFRVFKDMIGRVGYYRIAEEYSSRLSRELAIDDTKLYVYDVDALPGADRETNQPGVIMVGKERIEYWTKGDGYVTDLRRGTLGTGAPAQHPRNTLVVDKSKRNLIPSTETVHKIGHDADGATTEFALPVVLDVVTATAVQVFVGGRRATNWTHDGTNVTFATAPRAGQRVHVVVKQGETWYDLDNPTLGLQTIDKSAARFIRDKAAVFDL